jgi:hypothetical protein
MHTAYFRLPARLLGRSREWFCNVDAALSPKRPWDDSRRTRLSASNSGKYLCETCDPLDCEFLKLGYETPFENTYCAVYLSPDGYLEIRTEGELGCEYRRSVHREALLWFVRGMTGAESGHRVSSDRTVRGLVRDIELVFDCPGSLLSEDCQ